VRRLTNTDARFWKVITVLALPKVGDDLEVVPPDYAFHVTVKRWDWHDHKESLCGGLPLRKTIDDPGGVGQSAC
jgi:hypothetical protein